MAKWFLSLGRCRLCKGPNTQLKHSPNQTTRYRFIPIRMAIVGEKKEKRPRREESESSCTVGRKVNGVATMGNGMAETANQGEKANKTQVLTLSS